MHKKTAIWGAGRNGITFLERCNAEIVFFIDSNREKTGTEIDDIPIVHPDDIEDYSKLFIVVAVADSKQIVESLEAKGLIWREDYIRDFEWVAGSVATETAVEALKYACFEEKLSAGEVLEVYHTKEEYFAVREQHSDFLRFERSLDKLFREMPGHYGVYRGYCSCCESQSDFVIDYPFGLHPGFRETCRCVKCGCNSRMRFMVDFVKKEYPKRDISIYMNEYITPTYREMKKFFPGLIGSEFLGNDHVAGEIVSGIRHEDATKLSFADEQFDAVVSNDVYEHVGDFMKAFEEVVRCLKKGGKFIFSVPIYSLREETVRRAEIDAKGSYIEYLPKEYHGNPLSTDGSLVFTEFSYDIIHFLEEAGFSEVHFVSYGSVECAHFGLMPMIIVATK